MPTKTYTAYRKSMMQTRPPAHIPRQKPKESFCIPEPQKRARKPLRTSSSTGASQRNRRLLPACLFALLFAAVLCIFPEECAKGAGRGVECCLQVLIPSLFPFMILGVFTVQTGAAAAIGRLLERPFRFLFRLPGCAAPVLLMSMIGGYPVGPRSTLSLLESGQITREEAGRMLCFCVNAGPAFVLSIVGAGYLKSPPAGLLLLAGQLLSCCLLGLLCRGGGKKSVLVENHSGKAQANTTTSLSVGEALIRSTEAAVRSMASTCAFVILFGMASYLAAQFLPDGLLPAALTAFLEVTQGCFELSASLGLCIGTRLGWAQRAVSDSFPLSGTCPFCGKISPLPPASWTLGGLMHLWPFVALPRRSTGRRGLLQFLRHHPAGSSCIPRRRCSSSCSVRRLSSQPHTILHP